MKKGKKDCKGQVKQWSEEENISYAYGLIAMADQLLDNKRKRRLFVKLMKFTNRTSIQNRTHHEKMIKAFGKERCASYRFLYRFYYEKFIIRHLGLEQLHKELKIFISNLKNVSPGEKNELLRTAIANSEWLELHKHACELQHTSAIS
jgi:hypothetical protein